MDKAVELTQVSFQYKTADRLALKDISFSLDRGECAVITGPSASGKSTLCRCMNGLVPQVCEGRLTGRIVVAGMDTAAFRVQALAKEVGLVMQDPEVQIVGRTVFEDLAFGPRNFLVPKAEIRRRVSQSLIQMGLGGYEDRPTSALSGGEKQRLTIAGVLAMRPAILVLDDPASELDPAGRSALYRHLADLKQVSGLTLVIVEQKTDDILDMADRVFVLDAGELKEVDRHSDRIRLRPFSGPPLPSGTGPKAPSPAVLEVKNLNFAHTRSEPILKDISLTLFQTDFIALMGHNGAGKTSLVKHLNGLIPCRSGNVSFCGKSIDTMKASELARSVGFVFQNPDHQIFETSVEKEVAFGLSNHGLSKKEIADRVNQALCLTDLEKVRNHHPFTLGKGIRQLIAVASIVVLGPRVLIVDEPTTGMDRHGVRQIMEIIGTLHKNGTAILLITHDMDLAARHAERIVVMDRGSIILDAPMARALDHNTLLAKAGLIPGESSPAAGQQRRSRWT